jgi:hypothetical protein
MAFSKLPPMARLWSKSGQTLRLRFKQVMAEIGVTDQVKLNGKGLDLGSLRPGGATWLLQTTENSEMTRRRGRWINLRVMEIYIQEVSSFQFLSALPETARDKVFCLCEFFLQALQSAEDKWAAGIPPQVWFILWRKQVNRD